jgi:hypothetical protein
MFPLTTILNAEREVNQVILVLGSMIWTLPMLLPPGAYTLLIQPSLHDFQTIGCAEGIL